MPTRKTGNGSWKHWYNFVVPERSFVEFSGEILQLDATTKTLSRQTDPGTNGSQRPYIVDVYFEHHSARIPGKISMLMRQFDGVDVYNLIRRGEAKAVQ
jgi:hypothetical protein